MGGVDGIG